MARRRSVWRRRRPGILLENTDEEYSLQDIAVFMYKIKHKLPPQRLCNLFQLDSGSCHLRKREFVQPRFSSVTYGKSSLRYLGPKLWNDLTPRIRNLPSLKQFKTVIRKQDLCTLAANVSDCRGCKLCREWLVVWMSFYNWCFYNSFYNFIIDVFIIDV